MLARVGHRREWLRQVAAMLGGSLCTGCGYTVGQMHRQEVRSIYVPVFKNDTYRRGVEYQLTDAVHRQIQWKSHYRLAEGPEADTRLIGRITSIRKDVLGETRQDDPRELQLALAVQVSWEDQRTGQLLAQEDFALNQSGVPVNATADFAPEVGQSLATGLQESIDKLARKIVGMMETPW